MRVEFDDEADEEFHRAVEYLLQRSPIAADGLVVEFTAARDLLVQFPHSGSPRAGGFRQLVINRFAYKIVYRVEGDIIRVYAFAHQKRKPGYWRSRVK